MSAVPKQNGGYMPVVVGVVLKKAGKMYYFDPGGLRPEIDEKVIVETSRGVEIGEVVAPAREIGQHEVIAPLKKVLRLAAPEDKRKDSENKKKEKDAYKVAQEKIRQQVLPMKLVETECLFDGSKLIFYFTAEGRVDFRELVKDLAAAFKTRIELRQIGVRDEAKSIGGLGPCGRDLCCRTFLADFEPVSIKMAKEQNLPLNPIKISGVCSRLMCCLKYENEVYVDFRKRAPRLGHEVTTAEGDGRVVGFCATRDEVVVELSENQRQIQIPLAELKVSTRRETGKTKSQKPNTKDKEQRLNAKQDPSSKKRDAEPGKTKDRQPSSKDSRIRTRDLRPEAQQKPKT